MHSLVCHNEMFCSEWLCLDYVHDALVNIDATEIKQFMSKDHA